MDNPGPRLKASIRTLRNNAADDAGFAQRVALVCCRFVEDKPDPLAAIRTVCRLQ